MRKVAILSLVILTAFVVGCAMAPQSMHESFVYSYEEVSFHLQMAKEIITSLHASGDLVGEKYEAAKASYNQAVDLFRMAGDTYKKYLTAPDAPTAIGFRAQYRQMMLELTKILLNLNTQIKGGAA